MFQLDFTRTKANTKRLLIVVTCGAGTNMNGVGIVSNPYVITICGRHPEL